MSGKDGQSLLAVSEVASAFQKMTKKQAKVYFSIQDDLFDGKATEEEAIKRLTSFCQSIGVPNEDWRMRRLVSRLKSDSAAFKREKEKIRAQREHDLSKSHPPRFHLLTAFLRWREIYGRVAGKIPGGCEVEGERMLKEESRRLLDDISKARLVEVPRDLSSYLRRKVREYLNESRAGWLWDKEKAKKVSTAKHKDAMKKFVKEEMAEKWCWPDAPVCFMMEGFLPYPGLIESYRSNSPHLLDLAKSEPLEVGSAGIFVTEPDVWESYIFYTEEGEKSPTVTEEPGWGFVDPLLSLPGLVADSKGWVVTPSWYGTPWVTAFLIYALVTLEKSTKIVPRHQIDQMGKEIDRDCGLFTYNLQPYEVLNLTIEEVKAIFDRWRTSSDGEEHARR